MDDFGTGYSSLLYLRDLPFTQLKIDRAFVGGSSRKTEDRAIVESVASLGRAIGLRGVAEGVETETQLRRVVAAGCHAAQGFLWGRPVAPDQLDPDRRIELPDRPAAGRLAFPPPNGRVAARVQELFGQGASLNTIAAALNREGLRTDKQTRWTARWVARHIAGLP
jgi:hypothetical protein